MKQLRATQFHGFNEKLLNPQAAQPTNLGAAGVSNFKGFEADYSRPAMASPLTGAGVSTMTRNPATQILRPEAYSMYKKVDVQKGHGLYTGKSDPRNLNMYR